MRSWKSVSSRRVVIHDRRRGREHRTRALVNHCRVARVRVMCGEIHPVGADRVLGSAYLDGLGLIERADGDRRLAEQVHCLVAWQCEQHDRGDVVGHLRVHRFGYGRRIDSIGYGSRRDEAHHGRALGITAEHDVGVGAVVRHRNDCSSPCSSGSGGPLSGMNPGQRSRAGLAATTKPAARPRLTPG
jgi:hypothetical protein